MSTLLSSLFSKTKETPSLILGLGFGVHQTISLFSLILIARIYPEEQFGIYAIILSIGSLFSPFQSLRFNLALITCDDGDQNPLTILCFILTALFSLLFCILISGLIFFETLPFPNAAISLYTIPQIFFFIFTLGISQTLHFVLIRNKFYTSVAKAHILRGALRAIIQVSLGYWSSTWESLFWGECISWGVTAALYLYLLVQKVLPHHPFNPLSKIPGLIRRYKNFPLYSFPAQLFHLGCNELPIPLIASFYGLSTAGTFAILYRLLSGFIILIGVSIGDVFYRSISEAVRNEQAQNARQILLTTLRTFSFIAFATVMSFYLFTKPIISLLLGAGWIHSSSIVIAMIPWLICKLFLRTFLPTVYTLNQQRLELYYNSFLFLLTISVFPLASSISTPFQTTLLAWGFAHLPVAFLLLRTISQNDSKPKNFFSAHH